MTEYVVGIDVGTRQTKGVLLTLDAALAARAQQETGVRLEAAANRVLRKLLEAVDAPDTAVRYIAATGYGRYQVSFRSLAITDMSCHAMGAARLVPGTRSVLDIGAMNSRAMRVGLDGRVLGFRMNDKCASGAGRFLERVARALEVDLSRIGELSLASTDPQPISSICAVLAESEVINHVTAGRKVEDILRGAHESIAHRVVALLRQVGTDGDVTLTGGVTKNAGLVAALEQRLGFPVCVCPDAEYAGACGAALLGLRRLEQTSARVPKATDTAKTTGSLRESASDPSANTLEQ